MIRVIRLPRVIEVIRLPRVIRVVRLPRVIRVIRMPSGLDQLDWLDQLSWSSWLRRLGRVLRKSGTRSGARLPPKGEETHWGKNVWRHVPNRSSNVMKPVEY